MAAAVSAGSQYVSTLRPSTRELTDVSIEDCLIVHGGRSSDQNSNGTNTLTVVHEPSLNLPGTPDDA